MFATLIDYWREYKAAIKASPYDADNVQAMGMRFAKEWNERKLDICAKFDVPEDDFEYSLHHTLMPRIADDLSA